MVKPRFAIIDPPCVFSLAVSQRRLSQVEAAKTALLQAQREHLAHWALPEETQETQLAALQEAETEGLRLLGVGCKWGIGVLMYENLSIWLLLVSGWVVVLFLGTFLSMKR